MDSLEDALDVAGFIERTNQASSPDALFGHLRDMTESMGFNRSLFSGGSTDPMFRSKYGITSPTPIILNCYPDHWTSHYLSHNYIAIDPVFSRVRRQWNPVIWDALPARSLARAEKRLMNEAGESGLHNGVTIPLHGPDGDSFVISLASDQTENRRVNHYLPYLRLISAQFLISFTDLWRAKLSAGHAMPELTRRERECLQWAAHGKSAWEIGMILHISEATVRFHLSNSFTKLGAQNRINAIVRAVRWGMISL
jgi:Response regulator containing a CheY-like receiver domain and an HTH DNA-binding domain